MAPKISIVVPVYNLELYLERCLQSLVSQTLRDIEVVVVDDGSTDDSAMLIAEFAGAHPAIIKSFRKPNGGHGSACNFGIERATGEYVKFVDGDDWLDADTCEFMYERAVASDADMVVGNLRYHRPHGEVSAHKPLDVAGEALLSRDQWNLLFDRWATPCGRIYRSALFADRTFRFLPGIIFADVNFSPKSYLLARRILYVDRELYNYDLTRPTQTAKQTDRRILDVIPSLREMLDFYVRHASFEAHRTQLLRYTLRHCLNWTSRIRTLHGYDRQRALEELWAVPEEYFGEEWAASSLLDELLDSEKVALLRSSRRLRFAPVVWAWELEEGALSGRNVVEPLVSAPARA